MSFHSADYIEKHTSSEPMLSNSTAQRKNDSNQQKPNGNKDEQSTQRQPGLQSMATNQVDNINVPSVVKEVISSQGKALDAPTRTLMESHFGHDFSQVRVHTDAKAARSSEAVDARAYTVGNHIVFNTSEHKPGTLAGDALIAHELAHVVQQTDKASHTPAESSSTLNNKSLEKAADSSALGVIASILSGTRTMFGRVAQNVVPGFRAGLRLQRCRRDESIQAPPFMGAQSRETLEEINGIVESGGVLQPFLILAQVIVSAENPVSSIHTPETAEAMAAVPVIVRNSVSKQIDLLLIEHGNELSREEREFWKTLRGRL